ncbi:MAG: single-stranded DNA-binding protein [Bacteroidales bacterium]|nr:single-stranded DNA-binding protein [Bacteroidales bacterium]
MNGVNKVFLIGRLGRDPEVRIFESGVKKASFPVATSEVYKDKEGRKIEQTEWHNVVCWRGLADIAEQYLVKGKLLYVEGKLRTRTWEENGAKRYFTEIEADNFQMLSSKSEDGDRATERKITAPPAAPPLPDSIPPDTELDSDGLPF